MLQLADSSEQTISYDKAVVEGKTIVTEVHMRMWRLGEIADRIEPKYGGRTLILFAEEIGVNPSTLASARSVVRAWPEKFRRLKISFGVAQALVRHPDREQIALDNPRLTESKAREIVRGYFSHPEDEDGGEGEEGVYSDEQVDDGAGTEANAILREFIDARYKLTEWLENNPDLDDDARESFSRTLQATAEIFSEISTSLLEGKTPHD